MRRSEEQLLIYESDIKPNRFAAGVMCWMAIVSVMILILNETNVFRIDHLTMRYAICGSLLITLLPQCIISNEKTASRPAMKYVILTLIGIGVLILTSMLTFHATMLFVLPQMIATQYPSKRLNGFAAILSLVIIIVS